MVGAGIIGASIAYHLAKRGALVTILEKERPGAGTTHAAFGWLDADARTPESYYNLSLAGVLGWQRLSLEIGPALQIQWGGSVQWVATDEAATELRTKTAKLERYGYPIRVISREEIETLVPGVTPGPVTAATYTDIEGGLDPLQTTEVLLAQAQKFGAKLVYPCEVSALQAKGDMIDGIVTSRGTMQADYYVLATGFAAKALASQIGVDVPLVQERGIIAHTKPMPRVLDRVLFLNGGANRIKQNPDGRVVASARLPNYETLEPSKAVGEKMLAEAARYVPALKQAQIDFMTLGYATMRENHLPVAGAVRGKRNFFVAAMNSGITMAPIIGQLASLEILDGVATEALDLYRL